MFYYQNNLISVTTGPFDKEIDWGANRYCRDLLPGILEHISTWFNENGSIEDAICRVFYDLDYKLEDELLNDLLTCTSIENLDIDKALLQLIAVTMPNFNAFFEDYKERVTNPKDDGIPW